VTLEVKCTVTFIDFEGRSDGDSVLKIVQQIKPQEVVLVRANAHSTKKYIDRLRK